GDDGSSPELKQSAPGAPRQKPRKIDAFGHVRAFSPEFIVKRAEMLQIRFRDVLPTEDRLPDTLPPASVTPSARDPLLPTAPVPGANSGIPSPRGAPSNNTPSVVLPPVAPALPVGTNHGGAPGTVPAAP